MERKKQIIMPKLNSCGGDTSKQWFIFYSYRDELTGKMKRFRIYDGFTTCKTSEEKYAHAKALINKWRRKLKAGYNPFTDDKQVIYNDNLTYFNRDTEQPGKRRARKTARYYMDKFLEARKSHLSKGSYAKYQSQFRILNAFLQQKKIADYDISVIDKKTAVEFFNYLQSTRKLSGKSCNTYLQLLTALYNDIGKDNKLIENPFSHIKRYKETTRPQKPIKQGLINLIKENLEKTDPQLWLAAQFQYYCFIRPRELRFMKIGHINLYEGFITLTPDITKNSKARTVNIPEPFQELLFNTYRLGDFPEDYYVFTIASTPGPRPVSKNHFAHRFSLLRKRLNIPSYYTFYGFKHTGAVMAAKSGASIYTIKEQMGHSSIAVTEEYLKDKTGYEDDFFRKKMPKL